MPTTGKSVSQPAPVRGDLPFQTLRYLVQRRVDVAAQTLGSQQSSSPGARDLHPMASAGPGVQVPGDLHVQTRDARVDPPDLRQLVFGHPADLLGDAHPPPPQDEIHSASPLAAAHGGATDRSTSCRGTNGRASAWLTWSLAPHSPAEGFAAQEAV